MSLLLVHLWYDVMPGGQAEAAHRLRVPMLLRLLGCVGCPRSWYCVPVEIPLGTTGMCAHSFNKLLWQEVRSKVTNKHRVQGYKQQHLTDYFVDSVSS
jgi:hypothetical protein